MDTTEKILLNIEEEMSTAFNQGDLDTVLSCFDKNVVGFSSTIHDRLSGFSQLRKTFEFYLNESGRMEYFISQPKVQIHECTAIVSFYWTVAIIHGSSRHEIAGRGTHVYVRKENDKWTIIHEHFSRAHHDV